MKTRCKFSSQSILVKGLLLDLTGVVPSQTRCLLQMESMSHNRPFSLVKQLLLNAEHFGISEGRLNIWYSLLFLLLLFWKCPSPSCQQFPMYWVQTLDAEFLFLPCANIFLAAWAHRVLEVFAILLNFKWH